METDYTLAAPRMPLALRPGLQHVGDLEDLVGRVRVREHDLQELLAEIRPQLPFINELLLLNDLRNLCPPRPKSPLNFGPRFSSAIKRLD